MFEEYLNKFLAMKKADIIREGMSRDIWTSSEGNFVSLMKWSKLLLARTLADKIVWIENNL